MDGVLARESAKCLLEGGFYRPLFLFHFGTWSLFYARQALVFPVCLSSGKLLRNKSDFVLDLFRGYEISPPPPKKKRLPSISYSSYSLIIFIQVANLCFIFDCIEWPGKACWNGLFRRECVYAGYHLLITRVAISSWDLVAGHSEKGCRNKVKK